jgi:hypothetical protein
MDGRAAWLCRCDCGGRVVVRGESLNSGNTTSCGCMARGVKDEIGKRYGRLVVTARGEHPEGIGQGAMWECRCDCGKAIVTRGSALRKGVTRSCGCFASDRLRALKTLPHGQAARNQILRRLRAQAAERGYSCELSDELVDDLMGRSCHYCGAPPNNVSSHPDGNGSFTYSGIDRVDNSLGYTPDNVVPCCRHCNYSKRDRSVAEFLAWVERVYQHAALPQR